MFSKIKFWLECSRWYALPTTIFSWLIVFVYSIDKDGNYINGILALIGICLAHLATNLFDDYIDFHNLKKEIDENNNLILPNTQNGKCQYLLDGSVKTIDVLKIIALYCTLALIIGIYLFANIGSGILLYMTFGALIVVLYPYLSNIRLSEFAVALAYGPLLFGGTYFAMTGKIDITPFILAIPTMLFTVNLIYTDTFLDRDIDKKEGKDTLCGYFKTEKNALLFQKWLVIIAYISIVLIESFDITDWEILITLITIPLAIDLHNSLIEYSLNKESIPQKKWYHIPFENWNKIEQEECKPFMFRMYQARNLMIYFSILITISILFD